MSTRRRLVAIHPSVRSAASALTVASRDAPHQLASCSCERSRRARGPVQRRETADEIARTAQPDHDLAVAGRNAGDEDPAALAHEHSLGTIALREYRPPTTDRTTRPLRAQRSSRQLPAVCHRVWLEFHPLFRKWLMRSRIALRSRSVSYARSRSACSRSRCSTTAASSSSSSGRLRNSGSY
jgi:hypothetical protein